MIESDSSLLDLKILERILKPVKPLCVPDRDRLRLGTVFSIVADKTQLLSAREAIGSVAVKFVNEGSVAFDRHFDDKDDIF